MSVETLFSDSVNIFYKLHQHFSNIAHTFLFKIKRFLKIYQYLFFNVTKVKNQKTKGKKSKIE